MHEVIEHGLVPDVGHGMRGECVLERVRAEGPETDSQEAKGCCNPKKAWVH